MTRIYNGLKEKEEKKRRKERREAIVAGAATCFVVCSWLKSGRAAPTRSALPGPRTWKVREDFVDGLK